MGSASMDSLRDLGVEDGLSADGLSVRWDHGLAVADLRDLEPAGLLAEEAGEKLREPLPEP